MAYFFECESCNTKEYFNTYENPYIAPILKAKKQDDESVICSSCIASKTRLKGNYIIIEKGNN